MIEPGFLQLIERISPMPKEDAEALWSLFKPIQIAKKDFFLEEPKIANELGFLSKGFMRGYLMKDGNEVTSHFYFAPTFVGDIISIRQKTPTRFNIQALEDSVMYIASFVDVEKLAAERPTILNLFFRFMEHLYIFSTNRQLSFLYDTPIERYQKLFKERPKVVANIPLQYIASYLGINPETLSRIRKKMSKEEM